MSYAPPKSLGPLARRQARLAWFLLLPTILSVMLVIILPLMAIFWISFKPIALEDLRPASAIVREQLKGKPKQSGDAAIIRYKIRNSSQKDPISGVTLADEIPSSLEVIEVDKRCSLKGKDLNCNLGEFEGGQRETLEIRVIAKKDYFRDNLKITDSIAKVTGRGENILTNFSFTLKNFVHVYDSAEFWTVIYATLFYTVFGTIGALVVGLFAALLLNIDFRGKGLIRGLYLFPYVAPVIAVAFAWVILFDPFSGSINALLVQMGVVDTPINFFWAKALCTDYGYGF